MDLIFLTPLAAGLANASIVTFLLSLPRRSPTDRSLVLLYACLMCLNICIAFLMRASTEREADLVLFVLRHFLFLMPALFLNHSLRSAGRSRWPLLPAILYSAACLVLVNVTFWQNSTLLISGFHKYDWGYFPIGTNLARLMLGILFAYNLAIAFAVLRGSLRTGGGSNRMLVGLFAIWWFAALSFLLPFSGIPFAPTGPAVDSVVSVIIAIHLNRDRSMTRKSEWLLFLSGATASLSVGMLFTWIVEGFFVSRSWIQSGIGGLITASGALLFYRLWSATRQEESRKPLFVRLQEKYELTYQEALICEMLARGTRRAEVQKALEITTGTLKNHFTSIYSKTIDFLEENEAVSRDKLQRLTVFLNALDARAGLGPSAGELRGRNTIS